MVLIIWSSAMKFKIRNVQTKCYEIRNNITLWWKQWLQSMSAYDSVSLLIESQSKWQGIMIIFMFRSIQYIRTDNYSLMSSNRVKSIKHSTNITHTVWELRNTLLFSTFLSFNTNVSLKLSSITKMQMNMSVFGVIDALERHKLNLTFNDSVIWIPKMFRFK